MTQLLNMFNQLFSESRPAVKQARHYDCDGAYRGM